MSSTTATRQLNWHGRFRPDNSGVADFAVFMEFWLAAQDRLVASARKEHLRKKSESAKFSQLRRKVSPIFGQVLRDQLTPAEAGGKIKRLVPDAKLRREIFDYWADAVQKTPVQLEKASRELEREEATLAKADKLLKARTAICDAVAQLNELAAAGDAESAKALVASANLAVLALAGLEKAQPEIIGRIARTETTWPVLTDGKHGWERRAAEHIARLELGADMTFFQARFRQPRGAEINLPARTWAKAAVRTIEETRFRFAILSVLLKEFGSSEALATFCMEAGWSFGPTAAWVQEVSKLGIFSDESLTAWKRTIRKVIREQMPDFHNRPEWATQRQSALARGRGTPGEIQNAILDDIASALERLAPRAKLPKPAC